MVEYSHDEAIEMLEKSKVNAVQRLEETEEDLVLLRNNCTTIEVGGAGLQGSFHAVGLGGVPLFLNLFAHSLTFSLLHWQVNMARLFNWDVRRRREEQAAAGK